VNKPRFIYPEKRQKMGMAFQPPVPSGLTQKPTQSALPLVDGYESRFQHVVLLAPRFRTVRSGRPSLNYQIYCLSCSLYEDWLMAEIWGEGGFLVLANGSGRLISPRLLYGPNSTMNTLILHICTLNSFIPSTVLI
jgi:hypothetical protein